MEVILCNRDESTHYVGRNKKKSLKKANPKANNNVIVQRSNPQLFLASLKKEQLSLLESVIYASGDYIDLVNHRHIDASINLNELATMRSIQPPDGELHLN